MGVGPDPDRRTAADDPQPGHHDRCCAVRCRDVRFRVGALLAGHGAGAGVHGARHRRRQVGAVHDHFVQVGQRIRSRARPGPPAVLVVVLGHRPGVLGIGLRRCYLLVDSGRHPGRISGPADDRRRVHAPQRDDAHPRLAALRQPLPANHRTAQSQHGDPVRRHTVRPAGPGPDRSRVVDSDQLHGPCGAVCPGRTDPRAWWQDYFVAGRGGRR